MTQLQKQKPEYLCMLLEWAVEDRAVQQSWEQYSVSQKNPPWQLVAIFPKRLGIFQRNFTRLLRIAIYARLQIFIQLSATLMKLCHIKCDHPVHIMCAKCPPSAETHAGIFWHFILTIRNF